MKVLGIVTARGGSKSIPGKNIKMLGGKPLLAYTIEAAQKSGVIDRLIITTDDEAIARVAREYGCEVPFMRPSELAQDLTPHFPVLEHAVRWMKEHEGYKPDFVFNLQPTTPFRQPFHLQEALDLIQKTGADSVMGVAEIPQHYHPASAMIIKDDGTLEHFNGNPVKKRRLRRQDLPKVYWSTTAIYLFRPDMLFDERDPTYFGDRVVPYMMEEKYAVDLDTLEDWEKAERRISNFQ